MLLILIFKGTVSATYGTLIVLAISFAIAAIGKTKLLEVILVSHVPCFLSGALLYYGLLSMREQRYSSSQYYPRYFNIMSGAFMIMGMVVAAIGGQRMISGTRLLLTRPSDQEQVASLLKHLLQNSIKYELR